MKCIKTLAPFGPPVLDDKCRAKRRKVVVHNTLAFIMPLLFRPNASRREKIYTLGVLSLMGLAIYGMTNRFVAEPGVKSTSGYLALPAAVALFIPFVLDRHPSNKMGTYGLFKRAFLYLFLFAMLYGFSWAGLALGGPSVITHLFGQDRFDEFTVIWKSDGSWKRRECDYSVKIQERSSFWHTKVCVEKEFWQNIARGDTLRGKRRYSSLGSMIEEISRQ